MEDFDSWVARVKELLEAPPLLTPSKPKSHSRKRSHSERSLADLAKQADDLSSMALDNNLSTSVPTASTMQLLMGEGPSTAGSQPTMEMGTFYPCDFYKIFLLQRILCTVIRSSKS